MRIKTVRSAEETAAIEAAINSLGKDITILEAGCGRRWPLSLSVSYKLTGIDMDERAMKIRMEKQGDLDAYRIGSLRDADFPPASFDVIYCSYVLEHVVGVAAVLENFSRWLKPNGVIVIRVPDERSVYGFMAKHTPHWFHILCRRWIMGERTAGEVGHGPYPVIYDPAMSVSNLLQYADSHHMASGVMATGYFLEKRPWLKPISAIFAIVSLGWLKWRYANLTFILRA